MLADARGVQQPIAPEVPAVASLHADAARVVLRQEQRLRLAAPDDRHEVQDPVVVVGLPGRDGERCQRRKEWPALVYGDVFGDAG